jgi:Domain of unknown function (DUF4397)
MAKKNNIFTALILFAGSAVFSWSITSCGKSAASVAGLNIQYQIINLSPDLYPVNLFIDYKLINTLSPYTFEINQGYFYVPSIDTPYQIRSALGSQAPIFNRDDILGTGAKYSLFITGSFGNNQLNEIFTLDTSAAPAVGRGKIRFLNASPTELGGLDLTANGTSAFTKISYPNYSAFMEIPVGNYDFKINETNGNGATIKDLPGITIQDGRLYTIYAFGYTTRTDSAEFNAAVITNK